MKKYKIKFKTDTGILTEIVVNDCITDAVNSLIALYNKIEILRIRII